MRTLLFVLAASAASLQPAPVRAEEGTADGRIVSDQVTIDILPPHPGRVIETPEGFLRVEDGPDLDQSDGVGSFGTYHVEPSATDAVTDRVAQRLPSGPDRVAVRADGLVDTAAPLAGGDPCRPQRGRYLRRLLEMSGVRVDRPVELLDGLAGPGAGGNLLATGGNVLATGFVAPGIDPIKPLAWDQELRSLGRDLATCQERAAARP